MSDKEYAEILKGLLVPIHAEHAMDRAIELLDMLDEIEQEPCRNLEEIAEVIKSDVSAEVKCRMISNILTAPPHYFKEI